MFYASETPTTVFPQKVKATFRKFSTKYNGNFQVFPLNGVKCVKSNSHKRFMRIMFVIIVLVDSSSQNKSEVLKISTKYNYDFQASPLNGAEFVKSNSPTKFMRIMFVIIC